MMTNLSALLKTTGLQLNVTREIDRLRYTDLSYVALDDCEELLGEMDEGTICPGDLDHVVKMDDVNDTDVKEATVIFYFQTVLCREKFEKNNSGTKNFTYLFRGQRKRA